MRRGTWSALVGLVITAIALGLGALASAPAHATSCYEDELELIHYDVAAVRIDGVLVETTDYGTKALAVGISDRRVELEIPWLDPTDHSRLTFERAESDDGGSP